MNTMEGLAALRPATAMLLSPRRGKYTCRIPYAFKTRMGINTSENIQEFISHKYFTPYLSSAISDATPAAQPAVQQSGCQRHSQPLQSIF